MDAKTVLHFSAKLFFYWLTISILLFFYGKPVLSSLLPLLSTTFNNIADSYQGMLTIGESDLKTKHLAVQVNVTLVKDVYIQGIPVAPAGYRLASATDFIHNLVPVVIFYTLILSFPMKLVWSRFMAIALSVPLMLIVLVATIPTLLAGHIEAQLFQAAQNVAKKELNEPFIMDWVVFIETGGRWLIPLVLALICVQLSLLLNRLFQRQPDSKR